MKIKPILFLLLFSACCTNGFSQMMISKSNVLFAPMFKMITTSQEVKISSRVTTQTTVRTRPGSDFRLFGLGTVKVEGQDYTPFGATRLSAVGNITELRIYSKKKGAFRGFYFGPYFSYTHYKLKSASIRETFHDNNGTAFYGDVSQVIKLNVSGGGFEIGTQGIYANNHFAVDWTILGVGFGVLGFQGGIEADNTSDNFDLRNYPDDVANTQMGIERFFNFRRTVDATSVTIGAKIPWLMMRTGLSIGFGYGGNWHFGKHKNSDDNNNQPAVPTTNPNSGQGN